MKSKCLFILLFLVAQTLFAQGNDDVVDSLYREDQIYLGISFNIITNEPEGFVQSGFSGGVNVGFIRDMPINKRRNLAIGAGLGWAFHSYNQNLFIGREESGKGVFRLLNNQEVQYDSNRFSTQIIEAPIELRWRTSTPTEYTFWRIYAGVKFGYIYYFRSNFEQTGNSIQVTDFEELNRWRTGATLSVGRGDFNLHLYYSLNPLINGKTETGKDLDFNTLQLGIIFYIL